MKSIVPVKPEPLHIDMARDQVRVIEQRPGDLGAAKKAFARLNRNLAHMPRGKGDTIADLNRTRASRGRV